MLGTGTCTSPWKFLPGRRCLLLYLLVLSTIAVCTDHSFVRNTRSEYAVRKTSEKRAFQECQRHAQTSSPGSLRSKPHRRRHAPPSAPLATQSSMASNASLEKKTVMRCQTRSTQRVYPGPQPGSLRVPLSTRPPPHAQRLGRLLQHGQQQMAPLTGSMARRHSSVVRLGSWVEVEGSAVRE